MIVNRAVITAAAPDQATLPLQQLIDRRGNPRTALQMVIEEAIDAGIESLCVVICPGMRDSYNQAAGPHANRLHYVDQTDPRGYGDAIFRARDFLGDEPFLHLVSDHLYLSSRDRGCARQLVELASLEGCSVSGVQPTRENKLSFFGAVGASRVPQRTDLYEITRVVEKPTPTQAEQELIVAGLRAGSYLCLFGMHVLTPTVIDLLAHEIETAQDGQSIQLSPVLDRLTERERYLAMQVEGSRYNIGERYGLLNAQIALALSGQDRDMILTDLIELLATRP